MFKKYDTVLFDSWNKSRGIDINTSSCMTNCFGVGADTIIPRAVGEMKPSSTALSMKDSNEL